MKRNLTVVCVLVGACTLFFAAVTAVGAAYGIIPVIVCGAVMTLVGIWAFIGSVLRERIYERAENRIGCGDYYGALAVLDKASRNHLFFPLYRMIVYQLYVRAELAIDDVAAAAKHADCLRHAGGDGWKYRTAFYVVLFNLDWEDLSAAQAEYESFKNACAHSALYREQISVLDALFARLGGENVPLPEAAKTSPYPVVHRLIERY